MNPSLAGKAPQQGQSLLLPRGALRFVILPLEKGHQKMLGYCAGIVFLWYTWQFQRAGVEGACVRIDVQYNTQMGRLGVFVRKAHFISWHIVHIYIHVACGNSAVPFQRHRVLMISRRWPAYVPTPLAVESLSQSFSSGEESPPLKMCDFIEDTHMLAVIIPGASAQSHPTATI